MIIAVSFGLMILTLGAGGALTEIGPWYFRLDTPPWKPPNWAFGPIWSVIGIFTAFSAARAWKATSQPSDHHLIVALFAANAVLNILWSLFFFKLHRPDWALIEVAFLWLSVAVLMIVLWPIHQASSLLMLPYLLWVSIAAALNAAIVSRNAPFGANPQTPATERR